MITINEDLSLSANSYLSYPKKNKMEDKRKTIGLFTADIKINGSGAVCFIPRKYLDKNYEAIVRIVKKEIEKELIL